ncbi:PREDICTED: methionine-R-sulfoxide reductase B3 isoform X2 [Pseudopodoces humilis]|uniref:methionine-R-sulfoxide reductase B3 isoform X2 n=1 Tax=Pseudopodoces humilis TaxID=181119 RepID=UPI0006B85614|nr:PREDICTED: methionine-R-sulfoxide reductase B3 isoform X2 [Pseudopodoces humilis]
MSAFNLLHLVTKSQPVALRACGLPSGSCRDKKDCKVVFSQEELRKRLTPLQYHVTQEKGTESAFEGEYTHHKAQGIYKCVVCGTPLFKSETKFDSNSGWPSFYDVISPDAIAFNDDFSYGMHRIEISCSQSWRGHRVQVKTQKVHTAKKSTRTSLNYSHQLRQHFFSIRCGTHSLGTAASGVFPLARLALYSCYVPWGLVTHRMPHATTGEPVLPGWRAAGLPDARD